MRTERATDFVTVALPDGQLVQVAAAGASDGDGMASVGLRKPFDASAILASLSSIGAVLKDHVRSADASRTSVEVRLGFTVEAGKLVTVLLNGAAEASITVTYEWSREQPPA